MTAVFVFRRKRLITIEFLNANRLDEIQVYIGDINFLKRRLFRYESASALQITKQYFQIQIISCNRSVRMSAHGGVIFKKLHENIRDVTNLVQIH